MSKDKNSKNKRRDSKGRILRKGESQRKDGSYDYRYTDKDHKSRSHFLLDGKKWDDKQSFAQYLKPARHINEEANGLVPVSIDIDNIISMKVDGKTIKLSPELRGGA